LLEVVWQHDQLGSYYADLRIKGHGKENLLKEITALLPHFKIDLISLNSTMSKNNLMHINMTIEIHATTQLEQLLSALKQIPSIIDVKRTRE
jgi:GTP pyrophosphokinase